MPRNPIPIRPRVKDAKAYERALRRSYLAPMFRRLSERMAQATGATQAFHAMNGFVEAMQALPKSGVPIAEIQKALNRMEGYHRKRVIKTFKAALGVDIRPFLTHPEIAAFMSRKVSENVDLVKTIAPRMHESLKARLQKELSEAPFDQQRLTKLVRSEYKSSGYNLRRIVRDQNSKTIGGLTEARQGQLGIEQYQWITSQDERVRPTHAANSGLIFSWGDPPADTGHPGNDVQCRCVPTPIVSEVARRKLQGSGAHSIIDPPSPPPAPSPIPTPSPARLTYQMANKRKRLRSEEMWHDTSWNDAPAGMLAAVGETPALTSTLQNGKRAFYDHGKNFVNMDGHNPNTRLGKAMWRHEFGHHIDRKLSKESIFARNPYASNSKKFQSAMNADRNKLKPRLGSEKNSTRVKNRDLDNETKKFRELAFGDRQRAMTELSRELDLDLDEVVAFMRREGPLGGPYTLPVSDKDALVYRFLLSWKHLDVQGALDMLFLKQNIIYQYAFGIADDVAIRAWLKSNSGVSKMWSDLVSALTRDKATGGWGHTNHYYTQRAGRRQVEIFANVFGAGGESEFASKILKRFHGKIYDLAMEMASEMAAAVP